MASAVKSLSFRRVDSFFEAKYPALRLLPSICEALHKYDLFHDFELWHSEGIFYSYNNWKLLVKSRIGKKEVSDWKIFCADHPNMQITQTVFDHLTPSKFWSITDHYPDLVSRLHVQIRLMGNFGQNAGVLSLSLSLSLSAYLSFDDNLLLCLLILEWEDHTPVKVAFSC